MKYFIVLLINQLFIYFFFKHLTGFWKPVRCLKKLQLHKFSFGNVAFMVGNDYKVYPRSEILGIYIQNLFGGFFLINHLPLGVEDLNTIISALYFQSDKICGGVGGDIYCIGGLYWNVGGDYFITFKRPKFCKVN